MSERFLFYFVENSDQLSNSAKFIQHEGILEMPDGSPWTMDPDEVEQFMWKFQDLANDELDQATTYCSNLEVEPETRKIMLIEDISGRLPSASTDELKKLVASALERARFYKPSWVEDLDVGEPEETSINSGSSDDTDEELQDEDGLPADDDISEPARKRRKNMELENRMELDESTLHNDDASSMRNLNGRVSPMETDEQAERGGSSHSSETDATHRVIE
ncbi:hypothetical protein AAVH_24947 [Aphelenchoides avenae]|nr:hypothetical protein AAVH_24947 [Aphelenchus avenae]